MWVPALRPGRQNSRPLPAPAAKTERRWTAGGGLAFGFWRNWEVFGEYRYTSYQSNNIVFPIAQRSLTTTTAANSIEVGLNFKFNPIYARY